MPDFGLKIGIEGEKQFKDAPRDINQVFKVLGSEMALPQILEAALHLVTGLMAFSPPCLC